MEKSDKENVLAASLRLLNYRDRSIHALEAKLCEKGFSSENIDAVILTLTEEGFLDDRRFAAELTKSRIKNKNWGPRKIALDLHRKGIPRDIAQSILSEIDEETVLQSAGRALEKWREKRGASGRGLGKKDFARAYRHLESRGFARGLILGLLYPLRESESVE